MTAGGIAAPVTARPGAGRRARTQRSWVFRISSMVLNVVLAIAIAMALALAVVPRLIGGTALTVLSGSMQPLYSAGDMVVVIPVAPQQIRIGDVVAFQPVPDDPALVTHRVIAKPLGAADGMRFITRGDANGADDDPIVPEQVMGRAIYHVPGVGHLALAAGHHAQNLVLLGAVGLFGYAALMFLTPTRKDTAS